MCDNCDPAYLEFKKTFIEKMKEGEAAVAEHSGGGKIENPAFKTLIRMAQEGEFTLTDSERQEFVEYVIDLVWNVTVLANAVRNQQTADMFAQIPVDPSKLN